MDQADQYIIKAKQIWASGKDFDDSAVDYLNKAIALKPERADLYWLKAEWLWKLEADDNQALAAVDKYLTMIPNSENGYQMKAQILLRLKRNKEALAAVNSGVAISTRYDILSLKADCQRRLGDIQGEESTLSLALKQKTDSRDMRLARALARLKLKNYQGVVEDTTSVIKNFRATTPIINRKAYLARAEAYQQMHQTDKARQDYLDMLKMANSNDRVGMMEARKFFQSIGDKTNLEKVDSAIKKLDSDLSPI